MPLSLSSPRAALLAGFAAFGTSTGAWSGSIPTVMSNAGVDEYHFGIMATVATAATILAMVLGGRLSRHIPVRHLLLAVLPLVAAAIALFLLARSPMSLAAAFIIFGFAYGLGDLFINAEASAIEHDMQRPIFMGFHAAGSLMVAVFALLSSLTSVLVGPWLTALLVAGVYALAVSLVHRNVPLRPVPAATPQGHAPLNYGLLAVLGLAVGLVIAAETASLIWSAKLLQDISPRLAAIAGAGAAFYSFCAALVRLRGDALRARFGEKPVMVASLIISVVSFAALGLNLSFLGNVLAFAGVGAGLALLCPCLYALAAGTAPANRAGALGFLAGVAGAPRILAPWAFGLVATWTSVSGAYGFSAVVVAVALALILMLPARF